MKLSDFVIGSSFIGTGFLLIAGEIIAFASEYPAFSVDFISRCIVALALARYGMVAFEKEFQERKNK